MINTSEWKIGKVVKENDRVFWVVDKVEYKEYNIIKWIIEFLDKV